MCYVWYAMPLVNPRVWVLQCFKCGSDFEVEIKGEEKIIYVLRTTACPYCGHVPTLTRPGDLLSAVEVHKIVGVKS